MREVSRDQVIAALQALGVQPGDGLLVHSALQFLGKPVGGIGIYIEALQETANCELGIRTEDFGISPERSAIPNSQFLIPNSQGTLAVPTFTFAFARGEAYDPQNTPSQGMGAFAETVRSLPQALRTPHPLQSLAAVGREAAGLARRDTLSAFDPGSAFERLVELDFKLLLLGADINACSMLHYSEQRAAVPYRYWKDFSGPVRTSAGWETRTYRMFVRDLELDPHLDLHAVEAELKARGQWTERPLNYGRLALIRLANFVAIVDEFLARDPWSLVTNREQVLEKYKKIKERS